MSDASGKSDESEMKYSERERGSPDTYPGPNVPYHRRTFNDSKNWNIIDDPLEAGPDRPEIDPWSVVIEPLLNKDKAQCEAWKDEVNYILIFAGLFSGVVTAFVVESYKTLRPDPNDAIVALLTHIAVRLDEPLNVTSSTPRFNEGPFVQTSEAIQVNIFWFTSLILSLTAVLLGIISLQWLREHQSYPENSPKETFSLFYMRSEALVRWHVPHVFRALPLLLQAALVLFFVGLIDFAIPLGKQMTIIIAVAMTPAIFFLASTTMFPALQLFWHSHPSLRSKGKVPAPCPYKSPQSHAFRSILIRAFKLLSGASPFVSFIRGLFGGSQREKDFISPCVNVTWNQRNWKTFDLSWLRLRDAYEQGLCDDVPDLYRHREGWMNAFPLSDITQGLATFVKDLPDITKKTKSILAAVHFCFEDISNSIFGPQIIYWQTNPLIRPGPTWPTKRSVNRRNRYLHQLLLKSRNMSPAQSKSNLYLSDIFSNLGMIDGPNLDIRIPKQELGDYELLHHENMFTFLDILTKYKDSKELLACKIEYKIRIMRYLYKRPYDLFPTTLDVSLPPSIKLKFADFSRDKWSVGGYLGQTEHELDGVLKLAGNLLGVLFDFKQNEGIESSLRCIQTHRDLPVLMKELAWITRSGLAGNFDAHFAFDHHLRTIRKDLLKFMDGNPDNQSILFFYMAAFYLRPMRKWDANKLDPAVLYFVRKVILTMSVYKTETFEPNASLETRFQGEDEDVVRFSEEWWEFLNLTEADMAPVNNPSGSSAGSNSDNFPNLWMPTPVIVDRRGRSQSLKSLNLNTNDAPVGPVERGSVEGQVKEVQQ